MTDPNDPSALAAALDAASAATRNFGTETARTLSSVTDNYRRASSGGRDFGSALTRAFDDVALKGRSLSDTLKTLALDLSKLVLNNAVKSVANSAGSSLVSSLGTLFASADGNVIAGGRVKPFAKGGVLSSPMLFPLENGTGLAGEAGPEAIMPLQRGSDGRLGVAAQGNSQPVTIHFNVTATDAASFRRSETQIAAMLNRMANRGARNL
ncbi:phage tail tape measure protein [Parvibaculum sp.]|uniref:phage tail tape measure protein n=1 Tax=Parvibaculum sp. TaxID=2024848 RepID=UPI00320F60C5